LGLQTTSSHGFYCIPLNEYEKTKNHCCHSSGTGENQEKTKNYCCHSSSTGKEKTEEKKTKITDDNKDVGN